MWLLSQEEDREGERSAMGAANTRIRKGSRSSLFLYMSFASVDRRAREGMRYSMTSNVSVDSSGDTTPSAVFARTETL